MARSSFCIGIMQGTWHQHEAVATVHVKITRNALMAPARQPLATAAPPPVPNHCTLASAAGTLFRNHGINQLLHWHQAGLLASP